MVQQPFSLQHSLPESFTYYFLFSSATAQTMLLETIDPTELDGLSVA
jgi:hypothetical protein